NLMFFVSGEPQPPQPPPLQPMDLASARATKTMPRRTRRVRDRKGVPPIARGFEEGRVPDETPMCYQVRRVRDAKLPQVRSRGAPGGRRLPALRHGAPGRGPAPGAGAAARPGPGAGPGALLAPVDGRGVGRVPGAHLRDVP